MRYADKVEVFLSVILQGAGGVMVAGGMAVPGETLLHVQDCMLLPVCSILACAHDCSASQRCVLLSKWLVPAYTSVVPNLGANSNGLKQVSHVWTQGCCKSESADDFPQGLMYGALLQALWRPWLLCRSLLRQVTKYSFCMRLTPEGKLTSGSKRGATIIGLQRPLLLSKLCPRLSHHLQHIPRRLAQCLRLKTLSLAG